MKTTMTPPNLKSCLALAVMGLACAGATAQSNVTIYGNVDLGLLTGNNDTQTQVYNGGISPSIWGFKGTEDLGGGLKASFNLEAHFSADTGAQVNGQFRRQSNIAISSASLGTITLGNMYSPAVLAFAATDPRGLRENFSGLYTWALNSGVATSTGGSTNTDVGVFVKNAVAYSNNLGPVGVSASYSVAENANPASGPVGGSVTALGLTYTGPLSLSAAYQTADHANSKMEASKMYSVGAGYVLGAITVKANYLNAKNNNAAGIETNDVDVFGVGMDWKTSSANTLIAAFYRGKDKAPDTTTSTLILANEYALSKRTTLYGQLAFANLDNASTVLTSVSATGLTTNKNNSLLNVGIKHSF